MLALAREMDETSLADLEATLLAADLGTATTRESSPPCEARPAGDRRRRRAEAGAQAELLAILNKAAERPAARVGKANLRSSWWWA